MLLCHLGDRSFSVGALGLLGGGKLLREKRAAAFDPTAAPTVVVTGVKGASVGHAIDKKSQEAAL